MRLKDYDFRDGKRATMFEWLKDPISDEMRFWLVLNSFIVFGGAFLLMINTAIVNSDPRLSYMTGWNSLFLMVVGAGLVSVVVREVVKYKYAA